MKLPQISLLAVALIIAPLACHASTIQLPRTGQTKCYDSTGAETPCANTGQDGDRLAGKPWPNPRFTDNNNGTVTDNLTGLYWLKNASCNEPSGGITNTSGVSWINAMNWSNNLGAGTCGLTDGSNAGDWRLPNRKELLSLIDHQNSVPALPAGHPFTGVLTEVNGKGVDYWTSSNISALYWQMDISLEVYMGAGYLAGEYKTDPKYIWPVRDGVTGAIQLPQTGQMGCWDIKGNPITCAGTGQDGDKRKGVPFPQPRFTDNGNGTVTDNLNGLIWLKNANCTDASGGIVKNTSLGQYADVGSLFWQDALTWSNALESGKCGLTDSSVAGDWRLPNVVELESLIDAQYNNPAIEPGFFDNIEKMESYWSSTSFPNYGTDAWTVYMDGGSVTGAGKAIQIYSYVWPVRGGHFGNAVASVAPLSNDFGTVGTGGSTSQLFTISNNGTASRMHVNAMTLSGADAALFSIDPGDGTGDSCGSKTPIIPPNGTCTVSVSFIPTSAGAKTGNLTVSSSDVATPNIDITLTGTGKVNGVCGSASGNAFNTAPSSNLCAYGTPTTLTGNGPWAWTCQGAGGGSDSACSASIKTYTVTYTAGANGTLNGNTSQTVNYGSSTTSVTAVPDIHYHFLYWTGDRFSSSNPLVLDPVIADTSITANFAIDNFAVNFVTGGGGSISGKANQNIDYGSNATDVAAVPSLGYHFLNWSEGGTTVSTGAALTVTNVTTDHTYTANFAINTYGVTFTAGANGTLTGNTSQTVNHGGTTTTVTAVPNAGYHLATWTDSSTVVGTNIALTVSNITTPRTFTANFAPNTYAVTFAAAGNGAISGNGNQLVSHGADATTVTAVPATGFRFVNWTEGTTVVDTGPTLTITSVTAAHSYKANFAPEIVNGACGAANGTVFTSIPTVNLCTTGTASSVAGSGPWTWTCTSTTGGSDASCAASIQTYNVSVSVGPGATIAPATTLAVAYGSKATFTVTSAAGYGVVIAGCGGTLSGSTFTTAAIKGDCSINAYGIARNGNGTGATQPAITDAVKVLQIYTESRPMSLEDKIRYDVAPLGTNGYPSGNGVIDSADVILILRRSVGLGIW